MKNKLIVWVDLEKAEANLYNIEDLIECAKMTVKSFEDGRTAIALPMEYKDFFNFEIIKVDDDTEIEIKFIEKKDEDNTNENN